MKKIVLLAGIFFAFVFFVRAQAQKTDIFGPFASASENNSENNKAYQLMLKVFHRDDGNDSWAKTEMILIDKKGRTRQRLLEIFIKDFDHLVKRFLEFKEPADIQGTKFLAWENDDKDDTQYLYLPALGRARRIVSSQKSLPFVNTDFTYEDMQRRHPDKDRHKLIGQESMQGSECYMVESLPNPGTSQYSKRIHWIDKEKFVILRTDFYDKKFRKIKEFRVHKLERHQNIWTAMDVVMHHLKQRHQTRMRILAIRYNQGIEDRIFTRRYLEE